jgi:hypothetical protein
MQHIQDADRTLVSEDYETWKIVALESGMDAEELAVLDTVRLRLLGAAAVTCDVLGDQPPTSVVTEVLRQIHEVANIATAMNLYW